MIKSLSLAIVLTGVAVRLHAAPLGLPPVPVPDDNPQTPAKIALGDKLFHDKRISADGKVSCSTCHEKSMGFTDHKRVSEGFKKLTGTRNAPTVINSAYMKTLFLDGREPDLEGQSTQPPVNPVEGGLPNHNAELKIIRADPDYVKAFKAVFGVDGKHITMTEVSRAIASFERTVVAGDSAFDRYYFAGEKNAMDAGQVRGLKVFLEQGRCVSCHRIEQTQALFMDHRFHNIGIGFKRIRGKEGDTAAAFLASKHGGANVDHTVLSNENMSEVGRFAVTENLTQVGAFKTSTLRNIELTQPYMHDGSLKTLEDVIDFYNNGGRLKDTDPVSPFMSGGIRPLDLSDQQKQDLVAFLKALTSPSMAELANKKGGTTP